jgi:hypothetical protein
MARGLAALGASRSGKPRGPRTRRPGLRFRFKKPKKPRRTMLEEEIRLNEEIAKLVKAASVISRYAFDLAFIALFGTTEPAT